MQGTERICYITDVEGNLEYFQRIVQGSELLKYDDKAKSVLSLAPDAMLVFGGITKA